MRNGPISALVFVTVFIVHFLLSPVVTVYDSIWFVPISLSIIHEGNTDLDEYARNVAQQNYYGVVNTGEHLQSYFPVGASVLAVPFVFVADKLAPRLWHIDLREYYGRVTTNPFTGRLEQCIASIIAALAAVVMYLIARRYLSPPRSLLLVAIFAFGTSLWSVASRALWQHGPSILMLSLALYLLLRAEDKPSLAQFVSIPLAAAYVIRPTNSLSVIAFTVLIALMYRRYLLRYFLWAGLIAIPFLLFNRAAYGALLPPYYLANRIGGAPTFGEALLGNLVSPARGLLVYSPIFFLAGYGAYLKVRNRTVTPVDIALCCVALAHWVAISSFSPWIGGYSYGPRLFSDVVPYLAFLLIPVVAALHRPRTAAQALLLISFVCLAAFSFFTHSRGAMEFATRRWNEAGALVADVGAAPQRVWDWSDPQFLRGLRPGNLAVSPEALSVTMSGPSDDHLPAPLTLLNGGDKPVKVRVELPAKIAAAPSVVSEELKVLPQSSLDLVLYLDLAGYGPGEHSLGGVRIDRTDAAGVGQTLVVPYGLRINSAPPDRGNAGVITTRTLLPLVRRDVGAAPGIISPEDIRFIPPQDITVNGKQQDPGASGLEAVFGKGWFERESAGEVSWRWAGVPRGDPGPQPRPPAGGP